MTAAAFTPDGHTLATASTDKTTRLWDITDRTRPRLIGDPLTGHTDAVTALAFTPDGHTLATASTDKTTRLWDVSDPARPTRLGQPTHQGDPVYSVSFGSDGRTFATANADGTAQLWDLRALINVQAQPMEHACDLTVHGLDPQQWARYVPSLDFILSCAT